MKDCWDHSLALLGLSLYAFSGLAVVGVADRQRDVRVVVELKVIEDGVSGAGWVGPAESFLNCLEECKLQSEGRMHQRQATLQQCILWQSSCQSVPIMHVLKQHSPV